MRKFFQLINFGLNHLQEFGKLHFYLINFDCLQTYEPCDDTVNISGQAGKLSICTIENGRKQ